MDEVAVNPNDSSQYASQLSAAVREFRGDGSRTSSRCRRRVTFARLHSSSSTSEDGRGLPAVTGLLMRERSTSRASSSTSMGIATSPSRTSTQPTTWDRLEQAAAVPEDLRRRRQGYESAARDGLSALHLRPSCSSSGMPSRRSDLSASRPGRPRQTALELPVTFDLRHPGSRPRSTTELRATDPSGYNTQCSCFTYTGPVHCLLSSSSRSDATCLPGQEPLET